MQPQQLDAHLYDREKSIVCVTNPLSILGPAGALEAALTVPDNANIRAVGVICHPHPLYGGSMDNKVVHYIARSFNDLGLATVQFNFRGVGKSGGRYGEALGETDDLLAVLSAVREMYPHLPVWLAGFSFGAYVALRAATQWPVARVVTVAPPVNFFDFDTLAVPDCPWLLIQGDEDEIVPCAEVLAWAEGLPRQLDVLCMSGVGHFFHRRLNDLRHALFDHLTPRPALKAAAF